MTGRFGQLTYTSFDDPSAEDSGGGGWRIKQASADLDPGERDLALAHVTRELSLVEPLPRFPSASEIAAAPRRMTFTLAGEVAVIAHAVNAGADATGRPDNVFSHIVLDREPAAWSAGRARPVELWRWGGWLTPHGAEEVRAAAFDAGGPEPGGVVTRQSVVDFLFDDETYRFGDLAVLLDAVAGALSGGLPPVAVIAESVDAGAHWIGAVSYFLAPRTAAALTFSTYERLADVAATDPRVALSVVLGADVESLPVDEPHAVFVNTTDEDEQLADDAPDSWPTQYGQRVPLTDLGRLALDACARGGDELARWLDEVDAVSTAARAGLGQDPAWPLAMAMWRGDVASFTQAICLRVLLRDQGTGADLPWEFEQEVYDLCERRLGKTAADVWTTLAQDAAGVPAGPGGPAYGVVAQLAACVYLSRAVADGEWLSQQGGAPTPPRFEPTPLVRRRLEDLLGRILPPAPTVGQPGGWDFGAQRPAEVADLSVLGVAEWIAHVTGVPDAVAWQLDAMARWCAESLTMADGGGLARGLMNGSIAQPRSKLWLALADSVNRSMPAGGRLSREVVELLGQSVSDAEVMSLADTGHDPVADEVVVQRCVSTDQPTDQLKLAAGRVLLRPRPYAAPRSVWEVDDALRRTSGQGSWSVVDLIQLVQSLGGAPDAALVEAALPTLLDPSTDAAPALRAQLAAALIQAPAGAPGLDWPPPVAEGTWYTLVAIAELVPGWHVDPYRVVDAVERILVGGEAVVFDRRASVEVLAPSLVTARALLEVAQAGHDEWTPARQLRRTVPYDRGLTALDESLALGGTQAAAMLDEAVRSEATGMLMLTFTAAVIQVQLARWRGQRTSAPALAAVGAFGPYGSDEPPVELGQGVLMRAMRMADPRNRTALLAESLRMVNRTAQPDRAERDTVDRWWETLSPEAAARDPKATTMWRRRP